MFPVYQWGAEKGRLHMYFVLLQHMAAKVSSTCILHLCHPWQPRWVRHVFCIFITHDSQSGLDIHFALLTHMTAKVGLTCILHFCHHGQGGLNIFFFFTFAKQDRLVYEVTDTDRWAQNGSTHGCVLVAFKHGVLTNKTKHWMKNYRVIQLTKTKNPLQSLGPRTLLPFGSLYKVVATSSKLADWHAYVDHYIRFTVLWSCRYIQQTRRLTCLCWS